VFRLAYRKECECLKWLDNKFAEEMRRLWEMAGRGEITFGEALRRGDILEKASEFLDRLKEEYECE